MVSGSQSNLRPRRRAAKTETMKDVSGAAEARGGQPEPADPPAPHATLVADRGGFSHSDLCVRSGDSSSDMQCGSWTWTIIQFSTQRL